MDQIIIVGGGDPLCPHNCLTSISLDWCVVERRLPRELSIEFGDFLAVYFASSCHDELERKKREFSFFSAGGHTIWGRKAHRSTAQATAVMASEERFPRPQVVSELSAKIYFKKVCLSESVLTRRKCLAFRQHVHLAHFPTLL